MADTIQPFVAVSGLAVGVTATTVISDSASIPIAVSSFNGLTGTLTAYASTGISVSADGKGITFTNTGVQSFNGSTGAVTFNSYVSSFNGSTGAVTGVATFNGLTGAVAGVTQINSGSGILITGTTNPTITNIGVQSFNGLTGAVTGVTTSVANTFTALQTFSVGITSSGLTLTNQFNITNNSPDQDMILTCTNTTGSVSWKNAPALVHNSGSTKYLHPICMTATAITATSMSTTQVTYFPFLVYSTVQTKASVLSIGSAPTILGTIPAKVYATSKTTGKPTGPPIGDYGNITVTGLASTAFVSANGVTLNPGFYWVALGAGVTFSGVTAINNLRRATADTNGLSRTIGIGTPQSVATYQMNWSESAGVTLPPSTVGAVTEGTATTIVFPLLQIV